MGGNAREEHPDGEGLWGQEEELKSNFFGDRFIQLATSDLLMPVMSDFRSVTVRSKTRGSHFWRMVKWLKENLIITMTYGTDQLKAHVMLMVVCTCKRMCSCQRILIRNIIAMLYLIVNYIDF